MISWKNPRKMDDFGGTPRLESSTCWFESEAMTWAMSWSSEISTLMGWQSRRGQSFDAEICGKGERIQMLAHRHNGNVMRPARKKKKTGSIAFEGMFSSDLQVFPSLNKDWASSQRFPLPWQGEEKGIFQHRSGPWFELRIVRIAFDL